LQFRLIIIGEKLLVNLLFYKAYDFLAERIIEKGIQYDYVWANDSPKLNPVNKIAKKFDSQLSMILMKSILKP
jgi:hypothetical protein